MKKFIKNLINILTLSFFISLVVSCTQQKQKVEIKRGIFKSTDDISIERGITIIPGDTLVSLSKKYNLTISELIRANKLKPPYIMRPGKKIIIPKSKIYKVKKKDTFYSIAKCFKLTIKEIKEKNKKVNERKLQVGDKIYLPFFAKNNFCKKEYRSKTKPKIKDYSNNSLVFYWPTSGKIIATFGAKKGGRRNDGINILAPKGNPVRASLSGVVIYRGNELPAWGNLILIKHKRGLTTAYAHLDKFRVKVGDNVNKGDLIGVVGKTGNIDKHQLHFQIRKNSKPIDPLKYLERK